jgi:inner membrane protein
MPGLEFNTRFVMNISVPPLGRSLGLKLIMVCGLVLLMGIPTLLISNISYERSNRADQVAREVGNRYGGPQMVMGPVLSIPYRQKRADGRFGEGGEYLIFANDGTADIKDVKTVVRQRSLFRVPTYQAHIKFKARFDMKDIEASYSENIELNWQDARILVGVSDSKGLRDDAYLTMAGQELRKFSPARQNLPARPVEFVHPNYVTHAESLRQSGMLSFMDVKIGDLVGNKSELEFETTISLIGSQSLSTLPFAQSTKLNMSSDWPHPGFDGHFPPTDREINDAGFMASWSIPFLARGIPSSGKAKGFNFGELMQKTMVVKFVNPVNAYQKVNRALKYSILFIGLVFLTYFLFEVAIGVRVHAAQYILIGLAQTIFYLLLLAFAEHTGFTVAFLIASLATIGVTSAYAGAVFGGRQYIRRAAIVFGSVYALLYTLMRMEDFALMVGALTSFVAIAGTMYLTRNVNWYGMSLPTDPQPEAPPVKEEKV